ncbi:Probable 2-oxoglutarate-dependent dioxygenase AOP1.2 [Linum grandiflorum]
MGIADADVFEEVESLANSLWPHGNPSFSESIQSYAEKMSEVEKMVRRMIVERYGLEKYVEEHVNSTILLLRMMKYKPPQSLEAEQGMHPHTDKDMITILCQNQVDGLEIQTKTGNDWIHFKPSKPSSFVVMVGLKENV